MQGDKTEIIKRKIKLPTWVSLNHLRDRQPTDTKIQIERLEKDKPKNTPWKGK